MTTTDGSAKFKIKDMRTHHMCGEIVALVTTPLDYEHLLLCDGQTISADDYPELVAALGSNVLPNLNGRVLQGGSTAGEYKEAGLPNITGYSPSNWYNNINDLPGWKAGEAVEHWHGSTVVVTWGNRYHDTGYFETNGAWYDADVHLDASKQNPIYGASSTVQPPAYTVRYYICYG